MSAHCANACSATGVENIETGTTVREQTELHVCNSQTHEFVYSDRDFIRSGVLWLDKRRVGLNSDCAAGCQPLSRFDLTLRLGWLEKEQLGFFRYHLGDLQTKILPGPHGFVAQLNIQRGKERRKPQEIQSIRQSFNPNQFNFNKIEPGEILFEIRKENKHEPSTESQFSTVSNGQSVSGTDAAQIDPNGPAYLDGGVTHTKTLVVINVSPLEFGHCLIIPEPSLCLPQVLTRDVVRIGIESVLLSSHPGFRVGFNSLGAFASVNHLHLHGYYLDHMLCIESARTEPLCAGQAFHLLSDTPAGFLFYTEGECLGALIHNICKVTDCLVEKNIAHNLFVTRGRPPGSSLHSGPSRPGIRVIIWPRLSCFGAKEETAFNVALCELAGHLPFKNRQDFDTITEAEVTEIVQKYLLPEKEFSMLQSQLMHLLHE
ncbi:GDP-D-glucose phosphorylase 1-like [Huso huso]|uniref:GDP-D-glucose phosphorylase 1 n=1 Tax=Huso huso TaxID=61971 RepID=A0ABR0YWS8_HUSHU